jgi:limonene-1,2-epoxide hydrolase
MTPTQIAEAWLTAFNERNVDALVALYAEDCTHTSPKIRNIHPETDGKIHGKAALMNWWTDALERLPEIQYEGVATTASSESVFIEYLRRVPDEPVMYVAEVFEIRDSKIVASRVYHG